MKNTQYSFRAPETNLPMVRMLTGIGPWYLFATLTLLLKGSSNVLHEAFKNLKMKNDETDENVDELSTDQERQFFITDVF